jgi:Malectin domain/IPT/TIG domain
MKKVIWQSFKDQKVRKMPHKELQCSHDPERMRSFLAGAIYSAKYKAGTIRYLIPFEPTSLTLVVKSVFPRRGGEAGGTLLSIFGERFDSSGSPTVSVGGRECRVLSFTSSKITCTLPAGSGTVDIAVTTGVESATFLAGYRYITGLPGTIPLVRINAGGAAYTDSLRNKWEADTKNAYYSKGGSQGTRGATTATISGTADGALYQSYRVFTLGTPTPFLYVIPVPASGKYTVVLHFCEVDVSRATVGARVMDIWVENKLFRQNFDIATTARGVFIAVVLKVTETITDGSVSIELKPVTHNPIISAIEVYSVGKYA